MEQTSTPFAGPTHGSTMATPWSASQTTSFALGTMENCTSLHILVLLRTRLNVRTLGIQATSQTSTSPGIISKIGIPAEFQGAGTNWLLTAEKSIVLLERIALRRI